MSGGFPLEFGLCNGQNAGSLIATSTGTSLTTGNVGLPGTYVQLIAATAQDSTWITIFLNSVAGAAFYIDIGAGAGGSETAICNNITFRGSSSGVQSYYSFPLSIPAGTRIAARATCGFNAQVCAIGVILHDGAMTSPEGAAGFDGVGVVVSAAEAGPAVTPGTNVMGNYAQIIASTARDYKGIVPIVGTGLANTPYLLDIAIGAGGSEKVIIPSVFCFRVTGDCLLPTFWVPIPAGSRLAARASAGAGTTNINVALGGIYQ